MQSGEYKKFITWRRADIPARVAASPGDGKRVVFVMPVCAHDDVRGAHKQGYSLAAAGYDVVLLVRPTEVSEYLGMTVIPARAPFRSLLRPALNLPFLLGQSLSLKADLYIMKNPDTLLLAILLRVLGRKVIYDSQEDFAKRPFIRDQIPRVLQRIVAMGITFLERVLSRTTSGVLVTQQHQPAFLGGRTILQPNAPLVSGPVYEASRADPFARPRDKFVLIYSGAISERRGLWAMLDLVERMNEMTVTRLELLGPFAGDALHQQARQHSGWKFVNYRGVVPHAESLSSIRRAHVGLAVLEPVADYPTSSINKLYEYMEAGIPFIASDFPAWRVDPVHGEPGIYVDPCSAEQLYAAAVRLAEDAGLRDCMGLAGHRYISTGFNWDVETVPFVNYVRDTVGLGAAMASRK